MFHECTQSVVRARAPARMILESSLALGLGRESGANYIIHSHITYPHLDSFCFRPRLKQPRCRHIDPRAGVLDDANREPGLPQVSCSEEAADIRRNAADDDRCDSLAPQQGHETGMLSGDGVSLEIAIEPLA